MTPDMPATDTAAANLPLAALSLHDDPAWRAIVRRGVTLLLIATAALPALVLAGLAPDSTLRMVVAALGFEQDDVHAAVLLALLIALPLAARGVWLVTAPHAALAVHPRVDRVRRATRTALVGGIVAALLCVILVPAAADFTIAARLLAIAASATLVVAGWLAPLRYLHAVGRVLGDEPLARRAATAWRAAAVLILVSATGIVVFAAGAAAGLAADLGHRALPAFEALASIGLLGVLAAAARTLHRARRLLLPPDIDAMPADVIARIAAEGLIADDIVCHACTYNLRGLKPDGRCPECGVPIPTSLAADRLCFASPVRLAQLRKGATLFLWVVCLQLGMLAITVATSALLGRYVAQSFEHTTLYMAVAHSAVLVRLAAAILTIAGAWLVTAPQRGVPDSVWSGRRRWCIRGAALLELGWIAWSDVAGAPGLSDASEPYRVVMPLLAVSVDLVVLVAAFLLVRMVRRSAVRVPDRLLARLAVVLQVGVGLGLAHQLLYFPAIYRLHRVATLADAIAASAGLCVVNNVGTVIVFALLLLALFTLVRVRRTLAAQLAAARAYQSALAPDRQPEDHA